MTEDIDNLFAIAEIAGVFIGFAALVTVVARRGDGQSQLEDTFKLANVVVINVMIIAAALFPVVVSRYGVAPAAVWRISSAFLFAVNLAQIVLLSRTTQGFTAAFPGMRVLSLAVMSLSPFFYIPLLLTIFGLIPSLAPAFFLTAIVAAIFQSSLLFADLAIATIVQANREQ